MKVSLCVLLDNAYSMCVCVYEGLCMCVICVQGGALNNSKLEAVGCVCVCVCMCVTGGHCRVKYSLP